jgi:hypothetical protein
VHELARQAAGQRIEGTDRHPALDRALLRQRQELRVGEDLADPGFVVEADAGLLDRITDRQPELDCGRTEPGAGGSSERALKRAHSAQAERRQRGPEALDPHLECCRRVADDVGQVVPDRARGAERLRTRLVGSAALVGFDGTLAGSHARARRCHA